MKFTPVIKTLLIINIVFFAIECLAGMLFQQVGYTDWFSAYSALYPVGDPNFRVYEYLTYMFIHGDFWHLFFNMWQLIIFGCAVEQVYGSKRTAIYYILCGIGSAVAHQLCALIGIIPPTVVIGASGAIYGIMAAAAFNFPNAQMYIIPFPFPIKLKWLVAGFCAYDLFSGLQGSDGVAHFAHLGGLVAGLVILMIWKVMDSKNGYSTGDYWTSSSSYSSYDKGGDSSVVDKVKDMFKKKPKMTVVKNATDRQVDYEYNERKKAHNEEIDRILDKVRQGGFENLTEEEKRTLFDASKR